MRRRGFTMVEVTVFTAVGLLVITAAWTFFSSSVAKGKATDVKALGVQTNLLLIRALERDLAALYEDGTHLLQYSKRPGEGATLEFYRYGPTSPDADWGPLPLVKVTYEFDAGYRKVRRSIDGGPARPLFGVVERVNVRFPQPALPEPGKLLPASPHVLISTISTSREELRKPLEQRDPRSRTSLFAGILRERVAARIAYPHWNEIPWSP